MLLKKRMLSQTLELICLEKKEVRREVRIVSILAVFSSPEGGRHVIKPQDCSTMFES